MDPKNCQNCRCSNAFLQGDNSVQKYTFADIKLWVACQQKLVSGLKCRPVLPRHCMSSYHAYFIIQGSGACRSIWTRKCSWLEFNCIYAPMNATYPTFTFDVSCKFWVFADWFDVQGWPKVAWSRGGEFTQPRAACWPSLEWNLIGEWRCRSSFLFSARIYFCNVNNHEYICAICRWIVVIDHERSCQYIIRCVVHETDTLFVIRHSQGFFWRRVASSHKIGEENVFPP